MGAADKQYKVSDEKIYDDVRLRLASDAQVKGGALIVEVEQGVVTLNGKVKTEKQKERAGRFLKMIPQPVETLAAHKSGPMWRRT